MQDSYKGTVRKRKPSACALEELTGLPIAIFR